MLNMRDTFGGLLWTFLCWLHLSSAGVQYGLYEAAECYKPITRSNFFHEYKHTSLDGKEVDFQKYNGMVSLVVNVASFWVLTNATYTELNALIKKYGQISTYDSDGRKTNRCSLQVLGFPSNQFGHQEPGKEHEILNCLEYVRPGKGYKPQFDMFSKVDVNGEKTIGLYRWLRDMCPRPTTRITSGQYTLWKPITITDIQWNFEEFLIDHRGQPVRRFSADTLPSSYEKDIVEMIEECKKDMAME